MKAAGGGGPLGEVAYLLTHSLTHVHTHLHTHLPNLHTHLPNVLADLHSSKPRAAAVISAR